MSTRYKDEMTSEERLEALLNGEKTDRIPVINFIFGHYGVVNGLTVADIYEDAETSFYAQLRAKEMYGFDGFLLYGYAMFGPWEFGGKVKFPREKGENLAVLDHPVKNEEDAKNLKLPDDILNAGSIPIGLKFSKLQKKHGFHVSIPFSSPFDMACNIASVERFMVWMIESPEIAHKILRKCTDLYYKIADYWIDEFGTEKLLAFLGTAFESNELISPEQFEKFSFPYLKEIVEKSKEKGIKRFFTHICSEQTNNLEYYSKIPWPERSIFSFGHEMSLKKAAEALPEHIIGGKVTATYFKDKKPDEFMEECKKNIEEGREIPATFVLMAGCDIPPNSIPINVYQLVKATRKYGQHLGRHT